LIEAEFTTISYEDIIGFIEINDTNGSPNKNIFVYKDNQILCSPTSLRYIYHALTILEYYKTTNCENMVEVGCGYGGLCLAINYFARLMNIVIKKYNLVDLPEACNLINYYLNLNREHIHTEIKTHTSNTYGGEVNDQKLFFISNYCYTEIEKVHNDLYSSTLLPKTQNGFIIWQNGGNKGCYPVETSNSVTKKQIVNTIEEKPQTDAGYGIYKNYFVYF